MTKLLTAEEAANAIGIARSTLYKWLAAGEGPVARIIAGRRWWTQKDIAEWMDDLPKEGGR